MMKKSIIYSLIYLLAFSGAMTFTSCERSADELDLLGDKFIPVPANFSVAGGSFIATPTTVDFSAPATVNFSANLSHEVSWFITITGQQSGAVKKIKGLSNVIDASNSVWDGGANSNSVFFEGGETAIAVLSFIGTDYTLQDTVTITGTKVYDGQVINGVTYTLIDDFEGNGIPLASAGPDGADANTEFDLTNSDTSMQGNNSLYMQGTDVNNNSWSGGVSHTNLNELFTAIAQPTTTDPSEVFINLYIFGTGKANTTVQVRVHELEAVGAGTWDPANNDAYNFDQQVNWTGWRLVSLPYSSFIPAFDPTNGGSGDKIKEPHTMGGLTISLNSMPDPGASTAAYVDFVTITQGGRFTP